MKASASGETLIWSGREGWVVAAAIAGLTLAMAVATVDIVTFKRTPLVTSVLVPSSGAMLKTSQPLVASASGTFGVTKVEFHVTGGMFKKTLIGAATPTPFGWFTLWDTTGLRNGTYIVQSIAYGAGGYSSQSAGVVVTIRR